MRWKYLVIVLLGLLMIGTISKNVNAAVYVNENWPHIKYATATNWGHTITYKVYNSGNLQLQWYIPPQEGINPRYIFVASTSAKSTATYGDPLPICDGEYIIQKLGGSDYMAILSDPKSLSYAGADPWNGDHNHTLVEQVAYDSLSVALDLLNSYVATAKDIGQLMYDLAEGVSSESNPDNTYWDVRWDFCSFFGGGPTETYTYFKFEVEVPESDPLFEIKLISKVNDNPDSTITWNIMGDYPDYPRPIGITSISQYPMLLTIPMLSQKMLPEGVEWINVQVPTKYHGNVIIEKMLYKGQSVELYVITPEGLSKYGKSLGIPNDLIEHFTKINKPLYLIKNPNNVQVKVG